MRRDERNTVSAHACAADADRCEQACLPFSAPGTLHQSWMRCYSYNAFIERKAPPQPQPTIARLRPRIRTSANRLSVALHCLDARRYASSTFSNCTGIEGRPCEFVRWYNRRFACRQCSAPVQHPRPTTCALRPSPHSHHGRALLCVRRGKGALQHVQVHALVLGYGAVVGQPKVNEHLLGGGRERVGGEHIVASQWG